MFKLFDKIVDKVQDSVLGYIDKYLDSDMKPALKEAVTELVANFRTTVVEQVPERVGRQLKEADSDRVTGMIAKSLSGKVEMLLEKLLETFRPEVDKTTERLSDTITDETMQKVRSYLKVEDENKQQQAEGNPEEGTRAFKLPGMENVDVSQAVGSFIGLKDRMPTLERDLHDNFQPVGKNLSTTLWDKFIQVLNAVLNELFPWLELPVARDLVVNQQMDRSWFSERIDDITDVFKDEIKERIPDLYETLQEPVMEIINDMVKWLEDHSVQAAMDQVKEVVKKMDLVKME